MAAEPHNNSSAMPADFASRRTGKKLSDLRNARRVTRTPAELRSFLGGHEAGGDISDAAVSSRAGRSEIAAAHTELHRRCAVGT
ncbi:MULTISPECIES: hypothetical protein [unclassified Bradyrhizobium]|uniref:hypothetical protein n=1 Tax=unclassified Bradyrhizobium TaxID=2631580 RepID=UPI0028E795A2|nr:MULTISPECIES: hypothetical protein [unclassified Bradyrhizobium]